MVGIHQAPFSQGTHYTDSDVVRLREQLTPKLSEAGVDLVLSGHDHIYTRTHLMNGFDPVIPEGAAKSGDVLIPEDGEVLYLTSTTATGGKYYDFQDESGETHPHVREERARDLAHDSTARWRQDYNPDYTNISVSPTELKLTTYNINTPYVVDQVTLQKKDAEKPEEKPEETTKPTTEQKPAPEVVTTTQTSEKLVPTTKTSVGKATVTETSVQTTPATKTVENTKAVPTTVKETVTETSTVEVPTTITKNAEPEVTTVTSVGTATVTETSTQTSPETKVVEKTKTVPTTVTESITKNAEPQEPAGNSDADSTGKDAAGSVSGSSTGGVILTVLAILIAVLGAIFAALSYVHPQWIQDIRKQFNF